jgi:large subunit ribosomal protein L18
MNRLTQKSKQADLRRHRVRARLHGTAQRPRLSVHFSHQHVIAQIIDDDQSKTLVYSTTVGKKTASGTLSAKAALIGGDIAEKAKKAKIEQVVFDRGAKQYHGRVKALADAAREKGLTF